MTHIPLNNQEGLRLLSLKTGAPIFGNREGAPDHTLTDNNLFEAVIGGVGGTTTFLTRGLEGDIVKWNLDDLFDFPAITAKGFSTREGGSPAVYGSVSANFIMDHAGHLILANTKEVSKSGTAADPVTTTEYFPYRIRWSAFADPENFRVATDTNAGHLDLLEDSANAPILSMWPLRELIIAYKENSTYNLTVNTSTEGELFTSADLVVGTRGILAPKAVAPVWDGNRHFFISHDNFYIFDGFQVIDPANPAGKRIRDYFYTNLDYSKKNSIYVTSFPSRSECWIFFETIQHNREAICWDWEEDSWTRHTNLPARSARQVITLAGGEEITLAGMGDKTSADTSTTGMNRSETEIRGNSNHKGLARLFGEQQAPYLRDRMNGEARGGVAEETIEATVDLPATPLIVKSRKGEDMGVRMGRQTLRKVLAEMDLGLPDIGDSTFDAELKTLMDSDWVQVFPRRSDNLTLPVKTETTAMTMEPRSGSDDDGFLESNRYIFSAGDDESLTDPVEYIGVRIKFANPNYLEELGQVLEEVDGFDPY